MLCLAGCGSRAVSELPPAATPAPSPRLTEPPAGRLVAARTPPDPGTVTASGRSFTADRGADVVRVREGAREIATLRTGLEPAALAVADGGRAVGVLSVRERVLELFDARTLRRIGRANAGTGPARVTADGGNYLYVTDTIAGAVLVYTIVPELTLVRRYRLDGGPYAIAYDRERRRMFATLTATNQLAELTAGRRIRRLRSYPSLREPTSVAAGAAIRVGGAGAQDQLLDLPRSQ